LAEFASIGRAGVALEAFGQGLPRRRPELGTNGGAPTAVRRAVRLTSAAIKVDDSMRPAS
jgi:hypothetical protein